MKNNILKVCALGLVAVTLVTGCGKNEKEVDNSKSAREEIVQLSENHNDKKVVKVDIETATLNDETLKLFINATTKDGESVWKIELGTVPYGIGLGNWLSYQGENTYYFSTNSEISAYEIETGKEIWSVDRSLWGFIDKVEEKGNELHISAIVPEEDGHAVKVINIKDGSLIKEYKTNK